MAQQVVQEKNSSRLKKFCFVLSCSYECFKSFRYVVCFLSDPETLHTASCDTYIRKTGIFMCNKTVNMGVLIILFKKSIVLSLIIKGL